MAKVPAFDLTKSNSSRTESTKTNPMAKNPTSAGTRLKSSQGAPRGVEHPIPEDFALIGDTRHELHAKALPKQLGPHYNKYQNAGYPDRAGSLAGSDQFRVESGGDAGDEL